MYYRRVSQASKFAALKSLPNRVSSDAFGSWLLLAAAAAAILIARAPGALMLPSLPADDGYFVFSHFFNNRHPLIMLRHKGGYVPLLPNILAFAAVRAPAAWIPHAFVLSAIAVNCAASIAIFHRSFRTLLQSDLQRAILALAIAAAPFRTYTLAYVLDYSICNALWLTLLFSLAAAPESGRRQAALILPYAILLVSHPLGVAAMPVFALGLLRQPGARLWYAGLISSMLLYLWGAEVGGGARRGIESAQLETKHFIRQYLDLIYSSAQRSLGFELRMSSGSKEEILALFGVAALFFAWLAWRKSSLYFKLLPCAYYTFAVSAGILISRYRSFEYKGGFHPRYTYVQSHFFLLALAIAAVSLCSAAMRGRAGDKQTGGLAAAALAALFLWNCSVLFSPNHHPSFRHERNGLITRAFFARLEEKLGEQPPGEGATLIAVKEEEPAIAALSRTERERELPECLEAFEREAQCAPAGVYESFEALQAGGK